MKIKTLEFTLKKGLPNYSSVSAGMTVEVGEGENTTILWEKMKQEIMAQCNEEPSWMNTKGTNERGGE